MNYRKEMEEIYNKSMNNRYGIEKEIEELRSDLLNRTAEDAKFDYLDYLCEKFLTTKKGYHVDRNTGIIVKDGYHIENGKFVPDGFNYIEGKFISEENNNKKIK